MSWTVPLSSSPLAPSTPGSGQQTTNIFAKSPSGLPSNPSTTPAGPPPSSVGSFTPADPPPSSIFGSSQLGSGKTLFKAHPSASTNSGSRRSINPFSQSIDEDKLARFLDKSGGFDFGDSNGASTKQTFGLPSGKYNLKPTRDIDEEDYEDEEDYDHEEEDYDEDEEDEGTEDGATIDTASGKALVDAGFTTQSALTKSPANGSISEYGSSIMDGTSRGVKRSRGGAMIHPASTRIAKKLTEPGQESEISSIVTNMASRSRVARLEESDDLIIGTESILLKELYGTEMMGEVPETVLDAGLPNATESLCNFWRASRDRDLANTPPRPEAVVGIGPDQKAPPLQKAIFVSTLLLQLHHPPTAKGKQALAVARLNRLSNSATFPQDIQLLSNPTALPKVLLNWLDDNHNHYRHTVNEVQQYGPSPTGHGSFWDIVMHLTLRGKLAEVGRLLKRSNFQHARTARDDGHGTEGYHGVQIKNIERVVNRAVQVLEHCPSLQEDNWNIVGNEWFLFRKRIKQAMDDLSTFAEGRDRDMDETESAFEASNFGLRRTNMGLSKSARKAESKVPWTIYQNLKTMYGILLGGTTEIVSSSQDWVEATVGLTAWWDGDSAEDVAVGRLAMSRCSLRHSEARGRRLVDVNAAAAYIQYLASAFKHVTNDANEGSFQVESINQVELALASVFQGNVEGTIGILRGWSLPVTSAVAEISSAGGWFGPGSGEMADLHDDLISMSTFQQRQPTKLVTRDSIFVEYAEALSARERLQPSQGTTVYEVWELSMSVLNRLDDKGIAAQRIGEMLQRLPVYSDERMDKILRICQISGKAGKARNITERYADHIAETTDNYGTALTYYARAHCKKKVKDVLNLLISLSLVQSIAFPALKSLDPNLHALVFTPERSLGQLALVDPEAAEMLHAHLTGYATLRKFYDLRDAEVVLGEGEKPRLRPIARKNAAATALLAVISSAADSIYGGLYDENRGSIVQVDGLLALLGEAMVFVNQPKSLISLPHCFTLLRVIEDLQTVTSGVYAQCEEFFRSTLSAFDGRGAPASPRELLKKTMSSMTSAGSFSLVGSSMRDSASSAASGSRTLIKPGKEERRGWDWRRGLEKDAKGEDVLRSLRLGLAKDIAGHWIMDEGA